jgi:CBS domain-containing protein
MKHDVVFATKDTTIRAAATLMAEKSVGTLPVVDKTGALVGVTSMRDIIQVFLPNFVPLVSDLDFVIDYGDLGQLTPEIQEKANHLSVADIMVEPIAVENECSLIRALTIMHKHGIRDLPVLRDGKLVGIASRVDIGRAFLAGWLSSMAEA